MRPALLLLVLGLAACGDDPGSTEKDRSVPTGPSLAGCSSPLSSYCATRACLSFEEEVEGWRETCARERVLEVTAGHCTGVYWYVTWNRGLLGGGTEYYDGAGRLIGASLHTDYPAYCGGNSFIETFGATPSCPTPLGLTFECP